MEAEERDQVNAVLLLNEKIDERILEALKHPLAAQYLEANPSFKPLVELIVNACIKSALAQLSDRVRPMYYYGDSTSTQQKLF